VTGWRRERLDLEGLNRLRPGTSETIGTDRTSGTGFFRITV
jgi:hypothetical protein